MFDGLSELHMDATTESAPKQTETAGEEEADSKFDDLNNSEHEYNILTGSTPEQTATDGEAKTDGETKTDNKFKGLHKSDMGNNSHTGRTTEQTETAAEGITDNKFDDLTKSDLVCNNLPTRSIADQTEIDGEAKANNKFDNLNKSDLNSNEPITITLETKESTTCNPLHTLGKKGIECYTSRRRSKLKSYDKTLPNIVLDFEHFDFTSLDHSAEATECNASNTSELKPEPTTTSEEAKTKFPHGLQKEENMEVLHRMKCLYKYTLIICPKEQLNPRFVALLLGSIDAEVQTNHVWVSDCSVVPLHKVWGGVVATFSDEPMVKDAICEIQKKYSESLKVISFNEWANILMIAEDLYPKGEKGFTKLLLRVNAGKNIIETISKLKTKLSPFGHDDSDFDLQVTFPFGIEGHVKYHTQLQAYLAQIVLNGFYMNKIGYLQAEVEVDAEGKKFDDYVRQRFKDLLESDK